MEDYLIKPDPIKFDTENKWLKGEQYAHILVHLENYCRLFELEKFEQKQHPDSIYTDPVSKILKPKCQRISARNCVFFLCLACFLTFVAK